MSKVRINELARQLEVPSHMILDLLPELGVAEKKTHSSSIEDDVAEAIRKRVQGVEEPAAQPDYGGGAAVAEGEHAPPQTAAAPHAATPAQSPTSPTVAAATAAP